jgi:hypothetical protein
MKEVCFGKADIRVRWSEVRGIRYPGVMYNSSKGEMELIESLELERWLLVDLLMYQIA